MRCDYIAEGVIKATKELALQVPLIVRLQGTKEPEAKQYVTLSLSNVVRHLTRIIQIDSRIWSQDLRF